MADYDWGLRDTAAEMEAHHRQYELRAMGFQPIFDNGFLTYYQCRRGCGTLVWDPETHMENVCREFSPVVGGESDG
jgi:hypothetical protein